MQLITSSSLADVGGAIDVILIALIWLTGAIGTTLIAYLAQSWRAIGEIVGTLRTSRRNEKPVATAAE